MQSGRHSMNTTALTISSRQDTSDTELIAVAQLAEALGYHTLWVGESWGRDVFTLLTMIACHTRSLRLGTGIVPVFSRTPALIAQSIASLDIISHGRATLGLGTSGRVVIQDWHGLPYQQPLQRTREYIQIIRKALAREVVNYDGHLFQLHRFRMATAPVQQHLPIYLASLGPKNLELTGELADGWLPVWVPWDWLPLLKEQVARGAARAGRDVASITTAPQILCHVTSAGPEVSEAERLMRAHMAYYIGGMGSYYYNLFRRYGYLAETEAIREAWAEGRREKAAAAVSDEMLEKITIFGDAGTCRTKLEQFRRHGADMPVIAFPHGISPAAVRRTLEALAPAEVVAPSDSTP